MEGILRKILNPLKAISETITGKRVLGKEEVLDSWNILIEEGKGKAEEIFNDTNSFIEESEAPSLKMERRKMAPTMLGGIFGEKRDFLVVIDSKLTLYQIFVAARDYGRNLDISWYLTCRYSFLERILNALRIRKLPTTVTDLNLFELQDLTAYVTNCHHSLLKAVEKLMLALNQDPSKIDRKSKGFLGIS